MIQRISGAFYLEDICQNTGSCSVTPTQLTFVEVPKGCKQKNIDLVLVSCAKARKDDRSQFGYPADRPELAWHEVQENDR